MATLGDGMQNGGLYISGAGGHARSIAEGALSAGFRILAFVDRQADLEALLGFDVIPEIPVADPDPAIVIAIGDNFQRRLAYEELSRAFPDARFPNIVHATASISRFATVGIGNVFLQGSIVGSNTTIGDFTIFNTGSACDHDCTVGSFSSLAPFSHTGGGVSIGQGTALGIGSTVRHGISIGDNIVVGAKSYVDKSLTDSGVYYGIPAVFVRERRPDSRYL